VKYIPPSTPPPLLSNIKLIIPKSHRKAFNSNMQFIKTLSIFAILGLTVSAAFPSCAEKCFAVDKIEASGCGATDMSCLCNNQKFKGQAKKCVQSNCSLGNQISMSSFGSFSKEDAEKRRCFAHEEEA
jgi:hypothetical protein